MNIKIICLKIDYWSDVHCIITINAEYFILSSTRNSYTLSFSLDGIYYAPYISKRAKFLNSATAARRSKKGNRHIFMTEHPQRKYSYVHEQLENGMQVEYKRITKPI